MDGIMRNDRNSKLKILKLVLKQKTKKVEIGNSICWINMVLNVLRAKRKCGEKVCMRAIRLPHWQRANANTHQIKRTLSQQRFIRSLKKWGKWLNKSYEDKKCNFNWLLVRVILEYNNFPFDLLAKCQLNVNWILTFVRLECRHRFLWRIVTE